MYLNFLGSSKYIPIIIENPIRRIDINDIEIVNSVYVFLCEILNLYMYLKNIMELPKSTNKTNGTESANKYVNILFFDII